MRHAILRSAVLSAALGLMPMLAFGAEPVQLVLKDHKFTPDAVTVPAGERFQITLHNQDPTPSEFESSQMHFEKVVTGGGHITVNAGPLKPGTYKFYDEYHEKTAHGTVTAVAKAK
jgi:hypothetical protein